MQHAIDIASSTHTLQQYATFDDKIAEACEKIGPLNAYFVYHA